MRYYRVFDGGKTELSYDEALISVTSRFRNCQMIRDMLSIPNRIPGLFGYVLVVDEKNPDMVPAPGLQYLVPDGYEYDEFGERI